MSEAICIICGESVELCNQPAHLRTKHATPIEGFRFWMDAHAYFVDKPSMLVADIRNLCNAPHHGFFIQDVDGKDVFHGDGTAVSLVGEPHFYILLPATM